MKRRRFLSLALALMLIISLCACKTKVVDDSTDATHGNAPVTGQKRDETTTAPQTTKATESTTLAQRKTEKGKLDPNTGTYTGLSPLPKIKLTAADPRTLDCDGRIQLRRIQKRRSASKLDERAEIFRREGLQRRLDRHEDERKGSLSHL